MVYEVWEDKLAQAFGSHTPQSQEIENQAKVRDRLYNPCTLILGLYVC